MYWKRSQQADDTSFTKRRHCVHVQSSRLEAYDFFKTVSVLKKKCSIGFIHILRNTIVNRKMLSFIDFMQLIILY